MAGQVLVSMAGKVLVSMAERARTYGEDCRTVHVNFWGHYLEHSLQAQDR